MAAVSRTRKHWTVKGNADPVYSKLVMVAIAIGVVFVFSASFPKADTALAGGDAYYYLIRQLIFVVAGGVLMYGASRLSPEFYTSAARFVFPLGLIAMLMCRWSPWAHPVGQNWSWLQIGSQPLQPSELVKVVYVALLAWILARPMTKTWTQREVWFCCLVAMGLMCLFLGIQQDMGMMFLVVGVTLAMLILGGLSLLKITALAVLMGGGGAFAVWRFIPSRWERIMIFLHPEDDKLNAGYHLCQMRATLAHGGIGGLGLGMSPEKWGALPTAHTDSIFCIIGAELGLIGAIIMLLLVVVMAVRAFDLSGRAGTPAAWYLGCGIGMMMAIQSIINIAVATVSMPCTGLTLPFISYGGSSMISSMIAAGIVLGVSRLAPAEERSK